MPAKKATSAKTTKKSPAKKKAASTKTRAASKKAKTTKAGDREVTIDRRKAETADEETKPVVERREKVQRPSSDRPHDMRTRLFRPRSRIHERHGPLQAY